MTKEENFKLFYESFKNIYKDIYTDEEIREKVNWFLDKQESRPKSKQSVSVHYYDFLLDVKEIENFRKRFADVNIELGHYNQTGDILNAYEYADIVILFNDPYVINFSTTLAMEFIKSIYRKVRGKKTTSVTPNSQNTRNVIFEVETKEKEGKRSVFRIEGDLSDEQIDKLIDKIPKISSENNNRETSNPLELTKKYVADPKTGEWKNYNLLEGIKKAHEIRRGKNDESE